MELAEHKFHEAMVAGSERLKRETRYNPKRRRSRRHSMTSHGQDRRLAP